MNNDKDLIAESDAIRLSDADWAKAKGTTLVRKATTDVLRAVST